MDRTDQQAIESLFQRLGEAERTAPARDAGAEAEIARHIAAQPGAPYYMAQTIVVQQAALEQAEARIAGLESAARAQPAGGGGFLATLFGAGGGARPAPRPRPQAAGPASAALGQQRQGGGFLAGAAQTAVGVAGGVLLGNAIAGMFEDPAAAITEAGEDLTASADEAMSFDEDFEV